MTNARLLTLFLVSPKCTAHLGFGLVYELFFQLTDAGFGDGAIPPLGVGPGALIRQGGDRLSRGRVVKAQLATRLKREEEEEQRPGPAGASAGESGGAVGLPALRRSWQ